MMEVRKYRSDDIDECADLFFRVFTAEPWYDKWESVAQVKEYLLEITQGPSFEGFVICDRQIIGVCLGRKRSWWAGKEYFIEEMYVEKMMQGKGIGTKLFEFVAETLNAEGIKNFILLTGREMPAEKFYNKMGFDIIQSIVLMAKK